MSNINDFVIEDGILKEYNGSDSCMVIPDGVITVSAGLLKDKTHVDTVVIPSSVMKIERGAFAGGWRWNKEPEIFSVHMPDTDTFNRLAFSVSLFYPLDFNVRFVINGQIMEEVVIPPDIKSLYTSFGRCMDLKKLVVCEGVREIGPETFDLCENLTEIILPASLKSIGNDAFSGCPLTSFEIAEGATFKFGRIFGYRFPEGLIGKIDWLSGFMDATGIKNYIVPDNWKLLSEDSKARIFLTCQDAKMRKTYSKMLKPADPEPLSEAILCRLGSKISKKECEILAQFMLDYMAHLSDYALKKMFDVIAQQSGGAAALKMIDGNAGLKKKIADAPSERSESVQVLRSEHDVLFDNMGFDSNGTKIYNLGSKELHAVLQPDFNILIVDPQTGKTAKSVPKRGADPELYKAASSDFKVIVKAVKAMTQTCRDILFGFYLSAEEITAEKWKIEWTGNLVTRGLASMVVWQQGEEFFSMDEGKAVGADGKEYRLTEERIRVAHTVDMGAEAVSQWQRFFNVRLRKQPFLQIWEPYRCMEDIREDRYKSCIIRSVYLREKKTLGITAEWYNQEFFDGDVFKHRYLELEGFEIEATGNDAGDELEISRIVPLVWNRRSNAIISYLDRITVYGRIHKDDVSVGQALDQFTFEQITDFLRIASECSAVNVTAALLEYKEKNFAGFDAMDEFVID